MAVPASYNDILADPAVHDHVGDVWYQTAVRVPPGWDGRRVVLRFESATHRATVWVNDVEVVAHEGGYTPFEADVTAHVRGRRAGAGHRGGGQHADLADDPAGRRGGHPGRNAAALLPRLLQLRRHLHRPVWLYSTAAGPRRRHHRRHRTRRGRRHRRVPGRRRRRRRGRTVRVVLRDAAAPRSPRGSGATGDAPVPDVHRWAPGRRLPLRPGGAAGRRHGHAARQLPPERRRPDRRGAGHAVPHQRRAVLLHRLRHARGPPGRGQGPRRRPDACTTSRCWSGSARTPSAPRTTRTAEDVLDYADRHGVVVIDETAAVGINMGLGGGIFGAQGYTDVLPESTINEQTREVHTPGDPGADRARQEPSERRALVASPTSRSPRRPRREDYFEPLFELTRELDPTRPVGFVNVMLAPVRQVSGHPSSPTC